MTDRTALQLAGRHIIITGASSGIGRASALAAANKGATVLLLARRDDELQVVVEEIRAAGGKAFGYRCDITEPDAVETTVRLILEEHGHVDMLVNNAGRSIRRSVYRSTERLHDFERTMAVNYFGAVRMVLALLPHMRERKFGHIVNVSSAGVQFSAPRYAAYLASKAALDKFSDVAAAETLADKITFTTIHMPLVDTPMIAPTGKQNVTQAASPEWAAATVVRALIERPKRIDVPAATLAEYGALIAPKLKDAVMHRVYRRFPESAAAKGEPVNGEQATEPDGRAQSNGKPRSQAALKRASKVAQRLGRLVPGAQW
ncbi:SDR family NAD(P)-dependent oxidoreductase [Antrihabitans sp. YC2-6]|nr:SDR family NAD(P)-dependent oxidoreductase [Antrihabitans sp. YC2-6]